MAEIAGIFLSPFLQVFFEKMASSEFVDFFRGQKVNDGLLMKLKIKLLCVDAVAEDAEDKQFTNPDVKVWLDTLKDVVYDAEDVLDEIATKALQRKLDTELGTFGSKVRNPIATSLFVKKVEKRIKKLLDKLDFLVKQKENLRLSEGVGVGGNPSERLPTTSFFEKSSICGRNKDKEAVIKSLLSNHASDNESDNEVGVVAIVGMGGIGKTTLAQLAYSDISVTKHFDLKIWVCVSDPFDVFMVIKSILEVVTQPPCNVNNPDQLQIKLREKLSGKKFLLVLDDVWDKTYPKWETLSNALQSGAQESKVIITTRDYEVTRVMRTIAIHRIMELPKEDCWKLFVKYAFHDRNSNAYLGLEAIGRKIVEKCNGVPLAIKAIGAFLWSNLDVDEWNKVLKSKIWDSRDILPALRLSYKYLSPPSLKRCFAYCSIFPKDHTFKKDELVFLWMAEGFLPQLQDKTMKEVGDNYFLTLVSRSLFQQSKHDEYVMHDLISDFTKFISKEFTLCQDDDSSCKFLSTTRHFLCSDKAFEIKKFETVEGKGLRTIVFPNSWSYRANFLLRNIRCLRVLNLSHNRGLRDLPDAIGKFKQLRYLNLTNTLIKRLPNSICELCNLQILNLSHCTSLVALPRDLHKLINLSHLDITETEIIEMPINLGKLKCLQTLSIFIVGKHGGFGIEELGKLSNLRGSLSILDLQNVEFPVDAKDVILRDKSLEKLELKWRGDTSASENHKSVLHCLEPHSILRSLSIYGYGGTSFPNWVGDASFYSIASLRLENCKFCCSLPPLGQLPSLQRLSIVGLDGIVTVGCQFYGSRSSSMKPFGALEFLQFEEMLEWKEWFHFEAGNEGGAFPNLRELRIFECPKLRGELPVHLPSLVELSIYDCPQFAASFPVTSSPHIATLSNKSSIGIHKHTILDYLEPHSICHRIYGYGGTSLSNLVGDASFCSITSLYLVDCKFCCSLPPLGQLPSLQHLSIVGLDGIVTIGRQFYGSGSSSMKPFGALQYLRFEKMLEWKEWFPFEAGNEGGAFPNLRDLRIFECPKLRGELPVHLPSLVKLSIYDCPQFAASFPVTSSPHIATLSNKSSIGIHKLTILDCLEPHSICLSIYGYGGTSFPNWVGDASFYSIASLRLENCKFCCSLPPLGQLPSLQRLSIVGLDGIVTVGCQFYGSRSSSMKPFGALEFLQFDRMLEWKEWFPFEAENEGGAFPNLRELWISGCPKLTGELPVHLPSLVQLSIHDCRRLAASLPGASSLHEVTLSNCNTVILNELSIGIHELSIKNCSILKLPMHLNYSSLERLTLEHCSSLKSFPLFSKIRKLTISYCEDLESLTVGEQHEHDLLLSSLYINYCPNLAYFPQGGLRAPNLKNFSVWRCWSLRSLPDKMHKLLPSLETLYISDCPQVESFPEGGLPSNLNEISIDNCGKLFANRMGWGLQNLSCVRIYDESKDVESFPDEGLLPTSLTYLSINDFPNLKSLEKKGFQHLIALEELKIFFCPKLEFMPEDGLPASLSTINIRGCPLLTKELESREGPEWRKIAHVPNKIIDY